MRYLGSTLGVFCVVLSIASSAHASPITVSGRFTTFVADRVSFICPGGGSYLWPHHTALGLPALQFGEKFDDCGGFSEAGISNSLEFESIPFEPVVGTIATIGVLTYINGAMPLGGEATTRLSFTGSFGDDAGFLELEIFNNPEGRELGWDRICGSGYGSDGIWNGTTDCADVLDRSDASFRVTLTALIGSIHPLGFGEVLTPDLGHLTRASVPEPGTLGLLGGGSVLVLLRRRRFGARRGRSTTP